MNHFWWMYKSILESFEFRTFDSKLWMACSSRAGRAAIQLGRIPDLQSTKLCKYFLRDVSGWSLPRLPVYCSSYQQFRIQNFQFRITIRDPTIVQNSDESSCLVLCPCFCKNLSLLPVEELITCKANPSSLESFCCTNHWISWMIFQSLAIIIVQKCSLMPIVQITSTHLLNTRTNFIATNASEMFGSAPIQNLRTAQLASKVFTCS